VEAVLAAVYLDGGIGSARKIIQKYILSREVAGLTKPRDYKTALQELVQRESGQVLSYRVVGESGPDHCKTFDMEVLLNGKAIGAGQGRSKKEAEQAAAKAAVLEMEKKHG
jgi:ribonuclease-3